MLILRTMVASSSMNKDASSIRTLLVPSVTKDVGHV